MSRRTFPRAVAAGLIAAAIGGPATGQAPNPWRGERALPTAPDNAARYVDQARQAAVDNLAEARRFVVALTPPGLEGTTLAGALERLCATTGTRHRITADFLRVGEPVPLPTAHEVALLRIAQSALANTVRHADARSATVTLHYETIHRLDIYARGRPV